jgi:ATP-dependent HslUV protease subunit HslV
LRRLEALLLVADENRTLLISGTGDVIEPDGDAIAIGSGGNLALSAARALLDHSELSARDVATHVFEIAASIDIYTNTNFTVEELHAPETNTEGES